MFICNTISWICNPEFANHFILVDQMSDGISKSPMNFRLNGPIDTCSPNLRNNSDQWVWRVSFTSLLPETTIYFLASLIRLFFLLQIWTIKWTKLFICLSYFWNCLFLFSSVIYATDRTVSSFLWVVIFDRTQPNKIAPSTTPWIYYFKENK